MGPLGCDEVLGVEPTSMGLSALIEDTPEVSLTDFAM